MAWELGAPLTYLGAAAIFAYFSVNTKNPNNRNLGGLLFILALLGVLVSVWSNQYIAGPSVTNSTTFTYYANFSDEEYSYSCPETKELSYNGTAWICSNGANTTAAVSVKIHIDPQPVNSTTTLTQESAGISETQEVAGDFGTIFMGVILLVLFWFAIELLRENLGQK
jgi:hypothetical protein